MELWKAGDHCRGGFRADLFGDRGAHLAGEGARKIGDHEVVRVVGQQLKVGLVGILEVAGGDQRCREVIGQHQGERVFAAGYGVFGFFPGVEVGPAEGAVLFEVLHHVIADAGELAVLFGSVIEVDHGRGDLVEVSLRVPVGIEVERSVEQRYAGQGDQRQLWQGAAGHALEFGERELQRRH